MKTWQTIALVLWAAILAGCARHGGWRVDALPTRFEERQAREANLQPLRDAAFWRHQLELAESRLANARLDLELAQADLDWLLAKQGLASTNQASILEDVRRVLRDPDSPEPVMEKLPAIARGLRSDYRELKGLPPL